MTLTPGPTLADAKGERRIRKLEERITIAQDAICVHCDHISIMQHEIAQLRRDTAVSAVFDEGNPAHLLRLVDRPDKGPLDARGWV